MTDTLTTQTTKPALDAFLARGKIVGTAAGLVKFAPSNTNYVLHLSAPDFTGPLNSLMDGVIRVQARKVYTVPSGGNFISPFFAPSRTIQGRVRALDGFAMVVQAWTAIHGQLPAEASAVE